MPSAPADIEAAEELVADRPDPTDVVRRSLIKGAAIVFPLVITLFIVSFVLGFVWMQINPLVKTLISETFLEGELLVTLTTLALFIMLVFVIGAYAEYGTNHGFTSQFDEFMASIPGIGSVYTSFNEMSELLLDSDTDSFQDVKLVEYPGEGSYVIAFKTAETPDVIVRDTGNEDMMTLFMPMAPNPVMGGFVIHVSSERVVDVDLTVEQGIRSIVTSGVAIGEDEEFVAGLDEEQMRRLGQTGRGSGLFATGDAGTVDASEHDVGHQSARTVQERDAREPETRKDDTQKDGTSDDNVEDGGPDHGEYESSLEDAPDGDGAQLSNLNVEDEQTTEDRESSRTDDGDDM